MRVLVTGASGNLGRAVLGRLRDDGISVRATSRRPPASSDVEWVVTDLATGDGLTEAVTGVDAVLHLVSAPRGRQTYQVDVLGTRRLVVAAGTAGVRHIVYISIVGVDRVPIPYYRHKLAAEQVIAAGPVPWSVLRATQFPQFLDDMLTASARLGPVIGDRAVLAQPVDPRRGGGAAGGPTGRRPVGRHRGAGRAAGAPLRRGRRAWRAARGSRRPLLPVRIPGRLGRELRAGGLATEALPRGVRTWADHLADTYGGTDRK